MSTEKIPPKKHQSQKLIVICIAAALLLLIFAYNTSSHSPKASLYIDDVSLNIDGVELKSLSFEDDSLGGIIPLSENSPSLIKIALTPSNSTSHSLAFLGTNSEQGVARLFLENAADWNDLNITWYFYKPSSDSNPPVFWLFLDNRGDLASNLHINFRVGQQVSLLETIYYYNYSQPTPLSFTDERFSGLSIQADSWVKVSISISRTDSRLVVRVNDELAVDDILRPQYLGSLKELRWIG